MAINQIYLFLVFILNGIFVGLLFDFFRILRKSFKTANFVTYIEDILFWILTGISIIFCMYNFSGGSIRWFMFLGLFLGIMIYMLTLSKVVVKMFVFIITTLKSIIYNILIKPIYVFFSAIYLFLTKKFRKIKYKIRKPKKIKKI